MARVQYVDPEHATGRPKELLDAVEAKLGVTPNMMKAMAGSAVLEGYLGLSGALGVGRLRAAVAERIALAVSESNGCSYCLSVHSHLAENVVRVQPADIHAARHYKSADPKAAAALKFAEALVWKRGAVSDGDIQAARDAGLSDAEIAEVVGHVAVNVLTNYFNKAFEIDVDFPQVHPHEHAAAA